MRVDAAQRVEPTAIARVEGGQWSRQEEGKSRRGSGAGAGVEGRKGRKAVIFLWWQGVSFICCAVVI